MYFVTTKRLGKNPIIYPKATVEKDYKPSICIAPTVTQCLIGISALNHVRYFKNGKLYFRKRKASFKIYKTNNRGRAVDIFDSVLTGERRLYKPTKFKLVGTVPENVVAKVRAMIKAISNDGDDFYFS